MPRRALLLVPLLVLGCGSRSSLSLDHGPADGAGGAGGSTDPSDSCPTGMLTPLVQSKLSGDGVAVVGDEAFYGLQDGQVGKVGILGGAPTPLFQGEGSCSLASDGGRLFIADVTSGVLTSVGLEGTGLVTLADSQSAPQSLAVDATHVFWINYGFGILAGAVARVPKGGGEVEILADSIDEGIDVAVDDQAIYFTNWGFQAGVYRIDKSTFEKQPLTTAYSAFTGIAVDEENVYFAAGENIGTATIVARVPKAGGDVEVLASGQPDVLRVTVDETHVYWTAAGATSLSGSTARILKTGGDVEVLAATDKTLHSGIALDADAVYFTRGWLEADGPPPDGAAVVRVCK